MLAGHSSAIMVSEESNLKNPEVKKLAQDIIAAQKKEIAEMKELLKKIEMNRCNHFVAYLLSPV